MSVDYGGQILATLATEAEGPLNPETKVLYTCISVLLVVMAGLMSGLTIGLMAMDDMEMEVRARDDCVPRRCSTTHLRALSS